MHPSTAKSLIGLEKRLDRQTRLTYLPGAVYGETPEIKQTVPRKASPKENRPLWFQRLRTAFAFARA